MGGVVRVGIGVAIYKDGEILLGKRISKHGEGKFGFPGGHLELGESREECAKRETLEEAGIHIKNCKLLGVTNDIFSKEKHYVTIFIKADYESGNLTVMEPDKCEYRERFDTNTLPKPLFLPILSLLKQGQKL